MRTRRFGRLDWQVSEIGYGMWGMAGWTGSDDERSLAALHEAVKLGCTFFDTAWGYGEGHSERLLGQVVRAHPDKRLYTASKIPPKNRQWPSQRGMRLDDVFPADYIDEYAHKSLENLGIPTLDPRVPCAPYALPDRGAPSIRGTGTGAAIMVLRRTPF